MCQCPFSWIHHCLSDIQWLFSSASAPAPYSTSAQKPGWRMRLSLQLPHLANILPPPSLRPSSTAPCWPGLHLLIQHCMTHARDSLLSELHLGLLHPHSPGCCWPPPPMSTGPSPLLLSHAQPCRHTFRSSLVCQVTLHSPPCFSLPTCQRLLDLASPSPGPSLIFLMLNYLFLPVSH